MHGKFGLLSPDIVRRYPVVPPPPLCPMFLCFRNPPNSDMDYEIFNVHTFLCVTHGGGAHRQRIRTTFHSHNIFYGLDSNLLSWSPLDLEANASPIEPPRPPRRLDVDGLSERLPSLVDAGQNAEATVNSCYVLLCLVFSTIFSRSKATYLPSLLAWTLGLQWKSPSQVKSHIVYFDNMNNLFATRF